MVTKDKTQTILNDKGLPTVSLWESQKLFQETRLEYDEKNNIVLSLTIQIDKESEEKKVECVFYKYLNNKISSNLYFIDGDSSFHEFREIN